MGLSQRLCLEPLLVGGGAAYLGMGGLIKLRQANSEFWLFGLGVRRRVGPLKLLLVALAMPFLAYSLHRQRALIDSLQPELAAVKEEAKDQQTRLVSAVQSISDLEGRARGLTLNNQTYQAILERRETGLANQLDQAQELQATLQLQATKRTDLLKTSQA